MVARLLREHPVRLAVLFGSQATGTVTAESDDVVAAVRLAATTDAVGDAFNVGSGESVTIDELAETVRDVTDSTSDIVHTDPRPGDIERSWADLSKAQERLGFRPRVTPREGIESLVSGE